MRNCLKEKINNNPDICREIKGLVNNLAIEDDLEFIICVFNNTISINNLAVLLSDSFICIPVIESISDEWIKDNIAFSKEKSPEELYRCLKILSDNLCTKCSIEQKDNPFYGIAKSINRILLDNIILKAFIKFY